MDINQLREKARTDMGGMCHACPVCDGRACGTRIPGPGSKGGDAYRNYQAWQQWQLQMDTLTEVKTADLSFDLFGRKLKYPILAGPVGSAPNHYGPLHDDVWFNTNLIEGCKNAGILYCSGDSVKPTMELACGIISDNDGWGLPVMKPWQEESEIVRRMELVKGCKPIALAMDVDAGGLGNLRKGTHPAGNKSVAELRRVVELADGLPVIAKGILTAKGALKALEAGCSGIIVSNHGGRSLEGARTTAEALPEIAAAVKGRMLILVDGGIRSGSDVFRAMALGADAVMICRPVMTALYGGGQEGIQVWADTVANQLETAMVLCGAGDLGSISRDMITK